HHREQNNRDRHQYGPGLHHPPLIQSAGTRDHVPLIPPAFGTRNRLTIGCPSCLQLLARTLGGARLGAFVIQAIGACSGTLCLKDHLIDELGGTLLAANCLPYSLGDGSVVTPPEDDRHGLSTSGYGTFDLTTPLTCRGRW